MTSKLRFRWIICVCCAACSTLSALTGHAKVCVFVVNHFVSDAIVRTFNDEGYTNVVADDVPFAELQSYFETEKPEYVILDGTGFQEVDQQLAFEAKVISLAHAMRVKKLLLLSSFSIYPEKGETLCKENAISQKMLLDAEAPYTVCKLSLFAKCHSINDPEKPSFLFCLYPYLYGPKDPACTSASKHPLYHVIDRIVRAKMENRSFTVIASDGRATYDLLYIDDFAKALLHILKFDAKDDVINISTGNDHSVKELSHYVVSYSKYKNEVILDTNCYDSPPRRILSNTRLQESGWSQSTTLQEGVEKTVTWYEKSLQQAH